MPNRASLLVICGLWLVMAGSTAAQTWNPVWSDEFNGAAGTAIDTAKWKFETGILNVNNEVEYYCAPTSSAGGCNSAKPNAYIDGQGHLVIRAIKINSSTAPNSGSWTSARMTTDGTEAFQYGRAEARMMLPVGPGIWPAFWALGTSISTVGWPACGEIDYLENVPAQGGLGPTKISATLHGSGYSGDKGLPKRYTFPDGDVTGWHTYGAIWSPNMIQFYVDDPSEVFYVITASDVPAGQGWAFNHPFFLLMNLAVGGHGSWPGPADPTTPMPAVMTVDYVRIYKATAVPRPSMGTPAAITVKAGATSGNTTTVDVGNQVGTGRVFLSCTTTAARAACQLSTGDALNPKTLDFSNSDKGIAKITVSTNSGGETAAGNYSIIVNAYTVGGDGTVPDATVNVPLIVN